MNNEMITKYFHLFRLVSQIAVSLARSFQVKGSTLDDIKQAGWCYLVQTIKEFEAKGYDINLSARLIKFRVRAAMAREIRGIYDGGTKQGKHRRVQKVENLKDDDLARIDADRPYRLS